MFLCDRQKKRHLTWGMYHLFKMRGIFSVALHAIRAPLALCTRMFSFYWCVLTRIFSFRCTCWFCVGFHISVCLMCFTFIAIRDMKGECCVAAQRHGLPFFNCVSLNKKVTLKGLFIYFQSRLTKESFVLFHSTVRK